MAKKAVGTIPELASAGGFEAGTIQLWGLDAVRPEDIVYEVVSSALAGGKLELKLGVEGGEVLLTVWAPEEIVATKDAVTIGRAARIVFEEWDVSRKGEGVSVEHAKLGHFDKPAAGPALRLGRAASIG